MYEGPGPGPGRGPVLLGGPGLRGWFGAPREVRGPQLIWLRATSGIRGATGPFPSGERVRGRLPGEYGSGPQGSGCSVV